MQSNGPLTKSNKWALNLEKLKNFVNQKLLPDEAAKCCHKIHDKEMLQGLKKYMELELFPHIHMKLGKGFTQDGTLMGFNVNLNIP